MKAPAGGRQSAPLVEVIIASPQWRRKPRATGLARKAIRVAASTPTASTPAAELAIVLTNDSAIRALNHKWRKVDAPTNVLSFPSTAPQGGGDAPHHLGDIVIAYQTVRREAEAEHKPFGHHLAHLAVHGFLHLLGYDHQNIRDARRMERLEIRILAQLAVPDPYAGNGVRG